MKRLLLFTSIVCATAFVTSYLNNRDKEHRFSEESWVLTEGLQDVFPKDTIKKEFSTDSVKYIIYYGRTFVSREEVQHILADQRERCADVINYYK